MPKEPIPDVFEGFPAVSAERMRELDRMASDKFGLKTLVLMENAGRAVAAQTDVFLKATREQGVKGAKIVVCCGRGANGGDGLVAARYLS